MRKYFRAAMWIFDVALIGVFGWLAGCNPFFFLPPFHEGAHRLQVTTPADTQRVHDVVACLSAWSHHDYSDVSASYLVIIRVGGDGVIGQRDGATFQTDARENGDTIFINEGVSAGEFVGLERHESVHIAQSGHPELAPNGAIHWPPPFDACHVPLAVFR